MRIKLNLNSVPKAINSNLSSMLTNAQIGMVNSKIPITERLLFCTELYHFYLIIYWY